jgi:3D (Asp-Asp-Asp) domain-containing protein
LIRKSHKENRLHYYFPGIIGFAVSFTTIISLFTFYQARRNSIDNAAIRISNSVSIPSAVAAPAAVIAKPAEESLQAPSPSVQREKPIVKDLDNKNTEVDTEAQPEVSKKINIEALSNKLSTGKAVRMEATAYCINNVTASGVRSKYGIVAADPRLLPIGSIVRLYAEEYSGLYTVLDTGEKIKGRKIDIYLTDYKKAVHFGRRKIRLEVLRYGWNPQASSMDF